MPMPTMDIFRGFDGVDYEVTDAASRSAISEIQAELGYNNATIAGLQIDFENQIYTRLAGAAGKTAGTDFNTMAPFKDMKRCCVADDGTVNAYYGAAGYAEDGSAGQVMVEVPKFYYKVVPLKLDIIKENIKICPDCGQHNLNTAEICVNNACKADLSEVAAQDFVYDGQQIRKANFYVSSQPWEGFKVHPMFTVGGNRDKVYVGAYEGSIYDTSASEYLIGDGHPIGTTTTEISEGDITNPITIDEASVTAIRGDLAVYDGNSFIWTGASWHAYTYTLDTANDKFCSIAGVFPASGQTINLTRPNIETLCNNRGNGWHSYNTEVNYGLFLLAMIEYADPDLQLLIGQGVVNYASGAYNEAIMTGDTSALGNASGSANLNSTHPLDNVDGKRSISYRGIENFWGNIWKFVIDVNFWGDGTKRGGIPYIADDFSYAESKNTGNYKQVSYSLTNAGGYISAFGYDSNFDWLLFPTETKGNNHRPVGDYTYVSQNMGTQATPAYRIGYVGGAWAATRAAGPCCLHADHGVGTRARHLGGRLLKM